MRWQIRSRRPGACTWEYHLTAYRTLTEASNDLTRHKRHQAAINAPQREYELEFMGAERTERKGG